MNYPDCAVRMLAQLAQVDNDVIPGRSLLPAHSYAIHNAEDSFYPSGSVNSIKRAP
jgi:hypothetical protein